MIRQIWPHWRLCFHSREPTHTPSTLKFNKYIGLTGLVSFIAEFINLLSLLIYFSYQTIIRTRPSIVQEKGAKLSNHPANHELDGRPQLPTSLPFLMSCPSTRIKASLGLCSLCWLGHVTCVQRGSQDKWMRDSPIWLRGSLCWLRNVLLPIQKCLLFALVFFGRWVPCKLMFFLITIFFC